MPKTGACLTGHTGACCVCEGGLRYTSNMRVMSDDMDSWKKPKEVKNSFSFKDRTLENLMAS